MAVLWRKEGLGQSHDQPAIRCLTEHQTTGVMSAARPQLKFMLLFQMLLCPTASLSDSLLPSQEQPTFFNVRICRDRQVLSVLKAAAGSTLKADVILAHGKRIKVVWLRPERHPSGSCVSFT